MISDQKERMKLANLMTVPPTGSLEYRNLETMQRWLVDQREREQDIAEGFDLLSEGIKFLLKESPTLNHDERLRIISRLQKQEEQVFALQREQDEAESSESWAKAIESDQDQAEKED